MGGVWQAHLNAEDVRRWYNPVNWAETLLYQLRGALWSCGPGPPLAHPPAHIRQL